MNLNTLLIFYDFFLESYKNFSSIHGFKNTTLDRIDVNGNYTKLNCRWVTQETQANNKQDSILFKAIAPDGTETIECGTQRYERRNKLKKHSILKTLNNSFSNELNGWKYIRIK